MKARQILFNYVAVPILLVFGLVYFLIALVVVGVREAFRGPVPNMYTNMGQPK